MATTKLQKLNSKIYIKHLTEQYLAATGISMKYYPLPTDKSFIEDLTKFLKEREKIGEKYLKEIIKVTDERISKGYRVEVNKGALDSILLKEAAKSKFREGTCIPVTPYPTLINEPPKKLIITNAGACFFKNLKTSKIIPNKGIIETFITQNPYNSEFLKDWEKIPQTGEGNIVVGMYGKTYDKNYEEKLAMLREFKAKLSGNMVHEYLTNGDNYFALVATDSPLAKEKVMIKK